MEIEGVLVEDGFAGLNSEQIEFIVKYYGIIPARVIAEILGVSVHTVYYVASKLGLKAGRGAYPKHIAIVRNSEVVIYQRD